MVDKLKNKKSLLIIALILMLISIKIVYSYNYVENNIYIDNAGDFISVTLINVTSSPQVIIIPTIQPSSYIAYYINNYQTMPIDYNGTDLIILANQTGILNVTYISLGIVNKQGIVWSFNITENYYTKIFLPENSIPININPTPINVYYQSNSPIILMPPGKIFIQYTLSSQQLTVHKSKYSYLYIILIVIAIIIVAILVLFRKKKLNRSKKEKIREEVIDERDRQILNAIKRLGGIATANQIMSETGIPKTPLYRRLSKLVEMGYIEEITYGKTKSYKLKD